jgi:class 3 adenylate cyclase
LSNILPSFFVEKLLDRGLTTENITSREKIPDISIIRINEPLTQYCNDATVLLSDIVGFTSWSSTTEADDIVFMLNHQFSEFDQIANEMGLEKVKTIGDAYFCIGGLNGSNQCVETVEMALRMIQAIATLNKKFDWSFEVRIGVGSGPVRAAVFGNASITFDCFGEAVDIARLMESTALAGCVQVSESVYVKSSHKYDFIHFDDHEGEKVGRAKGYLLRGKKNAIPIITDQSLLNCPLSPSFFHHEEPISFTPIEEETYVIEEPVEEKKKDDPPLQNSEYKTNKVLMMFTKVKQNLEVFEYAYHHLKGIFPFNNGLQLAVMTLITAALLAVPNFPTSGAAITFYILIGIYVPLYVFSILPISRRYSVIIPGMLIMLYALDIAFLVTGLTHISISTTNTATFQFMFSITMTNMIPLFPFPVKAILTILIPTASILIRWAAFNWISYFDIVCAVIMVTIWAASSYFFSSSMHKSFLLKKTVKNKIMETTNQQQRNNNVLQSSLPTHVVNRLKRDSHSVHDHVENGSVCFIELDRFRDLYIKDGDLAVTVLNHLFTCFDELAVRHGCLKIKSIGNVYLVVAGIFSDHDDHLSRVANFALDARLLSHQVIEKYTTSHMPINQILGVKIGVQAGTFEACVLGTMKFLYDVFGDTINTASRMMSTGERNRIQVCGDAVQELSRDFELKQRGSVYVKGKGDLDIYFLEEAGLNRSSSCLSEAGIEIE